MTDQLLAAIRGGPDDPGFDDHQRLAMQFTDDVVHNVRAPDKTFQPLHARLSVQETQELTVQGLRPGPTALDQGTQKRSWNTTSRSATLSDDERVPQPTMNACAVGRATVSEFRT